MESLGQPVWIGQYRLSSRIATGGMAEVYIGRHISERGEFGPIVAVKRLLPHLVKDSSIVRMFLNEARITAQIRHKNVVQIHELGQVHGEPYIAMELLEGRTFADLRAKAAEEGKRVPLPVALRILTEACRGLDAAHHAVDEGGQPLALVHRDFTPDNIHVGVGGDVKVIDFGIAKTASWGSGTEPGTLKGKFFYMSPEMILAKPVDHRADIFAAGVMLYEQLCGRRPFTGNSVDEVVIKIAEGKMARPTSFDPSVPKALEETCLMALKKEPSERFDALAVFADAIEQVGGLATAAQVGAYVSSLFPEKSDERRITLRRALQADPSQPAAKSPNDRDAQWRPSLGSAELPPTVATPNRADRSKETDELRAFSLADRTEEQALTELQAMAEPARPTKTAPSPRSRRPLLIGAVAVFAAVAISAALLLRPTRHAEELLTEAVAEQSGPAKTKLLLALAAADDAREEQLKQGGALLVDLRLWDAALSYSEAWLNRNPKSEEARLVEARAAVETRNAKRAESAIHEALVLAPTDARPDVILAELRELQGEAGGAIEAWGRVAKRSGDVHALAREGYWMSQVGRLDEAETVLQSALRKKYDPEAAAELGFVKLRKEKSGEALKLLRRAVKEQPSLMVAHYYLASVLYQTGDVKGARAEYHEADQRAGSDSRPLVALCDLERQQESGELDAVKKLLRERFPQEAAALIAKCAP